MMYMFNIIQFLNGNVTGRKVVLVIMLFDDLLNNLILQVKSVL